MISYGRTRHDEQIRRAGHSAAVVIRHAGVVTGSGEWQNAL
jgi:hypothetical protein